MGIVTVKKERESKARRGKKELNKERDRKKQ
jgi:hypothetical protein